MLFLKIKNPIHLYCLYSLISPYPFSKIWVLDLHVNDRKNKCIDEYVMRKKKDIIIDKIFSYSFLRFWSFLWMHVFVYLICLFGYLNQNLIFYFTPCNSQSQSVWLQLRKCCMASSFNVPCILMFRNDFFFTLHSGLRINREQWQQYLHIL